MRSIQDIKNEMNAFEGKKSSKQYRTLKKELSAAEAVKTSESFGLGDVVESITKATGIKKVVEAITDDCGCDARKKALNELMPLDGLRKLFKGKRRTINPLSDEDYRELCDIFVKGMPGSMTSQTQSKIQKIYYNVFNIRPATTSCSPCLRGTVSDLYKIYQENSK